MTNDEKHFSVLVAHLLFFFRETSILVLCVVDTALPYPEGFLVFFADRTSILFRCPSREEILSSAQGKP